ncbi:unnamed protein product [Polarella glacialis]|uniref:Arf-GAP domain-containing protein n=1 Tax=Polarella glacialis TaxID=89957 RepID=A0A813HAK8_POLGL|nr:unnamed protein product [Polarella glacialis]
MAPTKVSEGDLLVERIRSIQRSNQANKRCADCLERGPTYVCLDFQTFVCQLCSGIHREFHHKIKSISLSEWNPAEVALIEAGGNEKAAVKWLDRWNKEQFPEPDSSDVEAVREFIRLKYAEKKWFRPHGRSGAEAPAEAAAGYAAAKAPAAPSAPFTPAPAASNTVAPQIAPMLDLLSGGASPPAKSRVPAADVWAPHDIITIIWPPQLIFSICKAPTSMPGMVSLVKVLGEPQAALDVPKTVPPLPSGLAAKDFTVPSLKEMGYKVGKSGGPEPHCGFPGGETAGLARLEAKLKDKNFILNFQKPKTKSTAFDPPSTTVLSPYLKFGCVSVRQFYHGVQKVCAGKKHTPPPESLVGQLLFREMSYMMGASIPNFDRQVGNPSCKQIPWAKDAKLLEAWETGRTGYPFIDAVMRQLVQVGWIHHLARHAVSCFLTRGDLWLSWEQGRDVFDRHLLDSDWAVNNMNWLSLSGAAPWSPPFFRVYSPTPSNDSSLNVQDPEGKYVRQFVPELAKMPSKYIYAPWTAPLEVQKAAGCIIGKDYPKPVVDHKTASAANIAKFKEALSSGKSSPAVAKPSAADKARLPLPSESCLADHPQTQKRPKKVDIPEAKRLHLGGEDLFKIVDPKVKAAITREFNTGGHAVKVVIPSGGKKRKAAEENPDDIGDEGEKDKVVVDLEEKEKGSDDEGDVTSGGLLKIKSHKPSAKGKAKAKAKVKAEPKEKDAPTPTPKAAGKAKAKAEAKPKAKGKAKS